ncbi:TAXI family TRAP transporter solute-binding subunit [Maledivibacter halophilus]|uniref:TRAP transporter solute receptor, TAXI family n=1 Tax=Maledivibacter halophilus TaxID=36842 RepID=A0A1T5IRL9_9FIRM|nr:TAXI family TRAP transporter solute-binding subunit [Maledivibacter halophilus]SKC41790.1 hypothetical protein SAMN02194393_00671 [Maledivibacter halophilus]
MKKFSKMFSFAIVILLVIGLLAGCGQGSPADEGKEEAKEEIVRVSLATGGTAGTYYPIGSGITAIVTKYVEGVEATAESTGASVANSKMLRNGEIEFILCSASTASSAYNGKETFEGKPVDNMRGIASLYPEVFQFVVLESSGLEKVTDLKGKKVAVGAAGSGTERISKLLLEAHGITYDDIEPQFLGFGEAVTALKDRLIDCAIVGSGLPTSAVVDASASLDINLLEVDKQSMEKATEEYKFLKLETISEGTYNGVNKDVLTVATPALFITSEDMDEEIVYKITKELFENIEELERVHAQGKNIKLETAVEAMSVPLHPGAEKYYKEKGILK